jgi:drug/metabolite transporter (DMT)-like permease
MNPSRAITLKLFSVLIFTVMSTCIKAVSPAIPPGEAVFFRSFFALVPIISYLVYQGTLSTALITGNPLGHVWRGGFGSVAMGLSFLALGLLPLPEVISIGYASPLLVTIFAAIFLKEEVRAYRWSAVMVGLAGVLVVLSPRLTLIRDGGLEGPEMIGAAAVLGSVVFGAGAMIAVRKLVLTERTPTIVFYFSVFTSLAALLTLPFGWPLPSLTQATLLVSAGLLGGIAQIFLTESYRHGDASTIAPFEYTSILFGLVIAYYLFDELLTPVMLVGVAIVVAAGMFIIFREHRLGLERERARKVATPQG